MTDTIAMRNAEQDLLAATSVKNTFIHFPKEHSVVERRNKSLPPSFRPSCGMPVVGLCSVGEWDKVPLTSIGVMDSDDSTDVRTDASGESPLSELGKLSSCAPDSMYETPHYMAICEPCTGIMYQNPDPQLWSDPSQFTMVPVWTQPEQYQPQADWTQVQDCGYQKLSSKAVAFQPSTGLSAKAAAFKPGEQAPKVNTEHTVKVEEMMKEVKVLLEKRKDILSADILQGATDWSLCIVPKGKGHASTEPMLAAAKDALLKAAETSRNVYVLGYAAPDTAFTAKPQGFEAQLGVMETMHTACWRVLKRGSCPKEWCNQQHPILQMPVQVFVEVTQLDAATEVVSSFTQEVANMMMMVAAMLTSAACGAGVQSFNDEDGQGWRLEISVRAEDMCLTDHFLKLAQNALTEATQHAQSVFIIRSQAEPFVPKSSGFAVMLGEMTDQSQACWDVFMQGCWRDQSCRWCHPQCLLPVNVVVKPL